MLITHCYKLCGRTQQQEENILSNIEQLESELAIVMKEKDEREKLLNDLQVRLDVKDGGRCC